MLFSSTCPLSLGSLRLILLQICTTSRQCFLHILIELVHVDFSAQREYCQSQLTDESQAGNALGPQMQNTGLIRRLYRLALTHREILERLSILVFPEV
jgi:hypothetical protein